MPVRVYEFAKQHNYSTKQIIELLNEGGFDIGSHMAVLDQKAVNYLQQKLKPVAPQKQEPKPAPAAVSKPAIVVQSTPQKDVRVQTVRHYDRPTVDPVRRPEATKVDSKKVVKQPGVAAKPTPLAEVAESLDKPVTEVIVTLLKWGQACNKNQLLPEDLVVKLAKHYQVPILEVKKETEEVLLQKNMPAGEHHKERLPVVVVLGHVDHGKTTLLDFIRKTRVASREKGGITQHLGAYEASTSQGNLVFLDTPGHEAFSKIRVRGVKVADIAVLVVAADDGVMPQTVEAIKVIKSMGVPVVVAVNKMDKADPARIDVIKRQLSQHDLLPEDWGGDVVCVPISAKTGKGVDQLLEMILLQSQIMELRADATGAARGYVLEAKLEKGRGPVATVICQQGTLHIGDYFKAGSVVGKVSSLVDSHGKRLSHVGPSIPVLIAGFEALPDAGDLFEVLDKDSHRKSRTESEVRKGFVPKSSSKESFNIIIKTDSNSSKEALVGSIEKLSKKLDKGYSIILAGVGDINDSDVVLAGNTGSTIVGLHVKPLASAAQIALKLGVKIKLHDIIYKLLEEMEVVSEGAKEVKMVKTKIGEAMVLKVFDIKGLGVIAGSVIKEGRFNKDGTVIIFRGNKKVGEGPIRSLQRDRKTVKEVHTGFECAFLVEGFTDWKQDDRVECYLEMPEGSK